VDALKRAKPNRPADCPFVGKGGLKLQFALERFAVDPTGLTAADLGCHVGGFTDCLLQAGGEKVYAVDTGYGILDYRLRIDDRVVVCERTNALYWTPPEPVDLVVIDAGWTRQMRVLPVAAKMLKAGGLVLSLVKPQYEADKALLQHGVLPEEHRDAVLAQVRETLDPRLTLLDEALSPIHGSGGNREVWFKLQG